LVVLAVKDGLLGGKPLRKIGWGLICNLDKELISHGTSTKDFIFLSLRIAKLILISLVGVDYKGNSLFLDNNIIKSIIVLLT